MLQQLHVRDQVNGRPPADALILDWQDSVPLTARTLISERVRIEWEARENKAPGAPLVDAAMMRRRNPFRGDPTAAEPPITLEAVTAFALERFARNAFFLVVDGRQIVDLDEVIPMRTTSNVTFVRLMPLKGG